MSFRLKNQILILQKISGGLCGISITAVFSQLSLASLLEDFSKRFFRLQGVFLAPNNRRESVGVRVPVWFMCGDFVIVCLEVFFFLIWILVNFFVLIQHDS